MVAFHKVVHRKSEASFECRLCGYCAMERHDLGQYLKTVCEQGIDGNKEDSDK